MNITEGRPAVALIGVLVCVPTAGAVKDFRPQTAPTSRRWLIAPAGQRAEIGASTTLADLTRQFGQANVHQATIPLGEGDNADGTVVYSDDPTKRLEVVWKDQTRRQPATIIVKGTESVWAIAPGISLGTSLVEIERLNGGPFTLAGFGFDYSGTIVEWQGGRLASLRTRLPRAFIRLEPVGPGSPSRQIDEAQVRGDREFSSGFGPMQRLNPGVYEFIVSYEAPLPAPLAHRMGPARPPASAIAR